MPTRKPRTSRVLFRLFLLGFATSVLADATRPQPAATQRPKLPTPPPPPPLPTLSQRPDPRPPVTPLEAVPTQQAATPVQTAPLADRPAPPRATEWLRAPEPAVEPVAEANGHRWRVRRVGATIFLSTAFFAGAAFSAAAGNEVVKALEASDSSDAAKAVETTSSLDGSAQPAGTDADSTDAGALQESVAQPSEQAPAQTEQAPAAADQAPAQVEQTVSVQPSSSAAAPNPTASTPVQVVHVSESAPKAVSTHSAAKRPHPTSSAAKHVQVVTVRAAPAASPVLARALGKRKSPLDPEAHTPGAAAAVWLNRPAPDPTPPSRRLTPLFADQLATTARTHGVDWALVLAVLRADGRLQPAPAQHGALVTLEERLGSLGARNDGWAAALKLAGDTTFADRTLALQRYYSAVGLRALVTGLQTAKPDLERRVLADPRLQIYPSGRSDIERHRVDVRLLALLEYLAGTYHQVTVSCLISGHRLYARPGVVSAHIYGRAVDISALDGIPVAGHQQPGGIVEKTVRSILLLPGEVEPRQVISLLGLGGASFPLANHWNHVHVGY